MSQPLIIPKALRQGDTIGLISPSTRLNDRLPTTLSRGIQNIQELGFRVKTFYTSYESSAAIKDGIRVRCDEIHAAFEDDSVAAIVCTLGGMHANELLSFLDYELIRQHPKIFVGYSDTTFLHWAINSQTGLRTFYGPTVYSDLADHPSPLPFTIDHFLHVLTAEGKGKPIGPLPRSELCMMDVAPFLLHGDESTGVRMPQQTPAWRWLRGGRAQGRLYGGTVSCIRRLLLSRYQPHSWAGKILFLETSMLGDVNKPFGVADVREALVDLSLAGVLVQVSGLVLGRCYKYTDAMQDQLAAMVVEIFESIVWRGIARKADFPILMNVDFGHTSPLLTMPFDSLASLDSTMDEFEILEPGVCM